MQRSVRHVGSLAEGERAASNRRRRHDHHPESSWAVDSDWNRGPAGGANPAIGNRPSPERSSSAAASPPATASRRRTESRRASIRRAQPTAGRSTSSTPSPKRRNDNSDQLTQRRLGPALLFFAGTIGDRMSAQSRTIHLP